MPSINFFYEDTDFRLTQIRKYKSWLSASINREGRSVSEINFIFTSDTYLHQLNVAHLTRILMPETWEGHPLRRDYSQGRIPVQFKGDRSPR